MKKLHFSKTYFNNLIFEDYKSKIRIVITETPSLDVSEEDYSLRIETRHEEERTVHRNYAIEHHLNQKHNYPHLQFKFHSEEIGVLRIKLELKDSDEYEKAILGFIYKIKNVLENLEKYKKGITEDILILDLVEKLNAENDFLNKKIRESLSANLIDLEDPKKIKNIAKNPLLVEFLGEKMIEQIEKMK